MRTITVAGRKVGDDMPPFIVAEAGLNHNGSVERALEMVAAAKEAGCDAIKFATFKADEFCAKDDPLYPAFKAAELPYFAWRRLKDECDLRDIIFFSTPQNESDLNLLLDVGVPAIKVGSDDLTNTALLRAYAKHRLPMIISTGMADMADIDEAIHEIWDHAPLLVCICTSEYPCPPAHSNLQRLRTLRYVYASLPLGFSDHTVGAHNSSAMIASAFGASYFEKHFTLDNNLPGPDHYFSAAPIDLSVWAWAIRNAKEIVGDGIIAPTVSERINRDKWRRKSGQKIRGET